VVAAVRLVGTLGGAVLRGVARPGGGGRRRATLRDGRVRGEGGTRHRGRGGRRVPGGAAEARAAGGAGEGRAAGAVALRYLEVSGAGFAAYRAAAVDVAFRVEPGPGWALGAVAEAVLGDVPGDPRGRGRRTSVGAVRSVGPLSFHAEAQRTEDRPLAAVGGVAWDVSGFRLAVGGREDPASLAGGLSLPLPGVVVTVAGSWVPPLGTTVRLGVCFKAGSPGLATNHSSAWTESRSVGWRSALRVLPGPEG
jgi:hypothetical protein